MMRIDNQGYAPGSVTGSHPNKKPEQAQELNRQTNAANLNRISGPAKRDTIEISQHSHSERPTLSQAKESIMQGLREEKDSQFLTVLKSKIESGSYTVDATELARILLDRIE